MTDEKLNAILARQMPDAEKRKRAISWWIRRTVLIPCGRESGTFWSRLLRWPRDDPDSSFPGSLFMREIVLDTETTGLDPSDGHRVVEIACLELINHMPTGRNYQVYLNPERDMPAEASAIHGLTTQFLADKPRFGRGRGEIPGVCRRCAAGHPQRRVRYAVHECRARPNKRPAISRERLVDTLLLARRKHPGVSNRLDDLCSRYAIDNSRRTKHGALLDAELLAEVYIDLIGARQSQLILARGIPRYACGRIW